MNKSRRYYLRGGLFSLGAALSLTKTAKAFEQCHQLTPGQTEGPFYPIADQFDKDNDLTIVQGKNKKALGEVIIIQGKVIDENCAPVENVLVEIWQACETGKYNHPADPNPAKLDPNFQYWGRAVTNKKGEYSFKTILPGQYKAASDWIRPPHIHFKVHRRGFEELTSQFYFKDHPLNKFDRVLQSLHPDDRKKVIVDLGPERTTSSKSNVSPRTGTFDISIRSL